MIGRHKGKLKEIGIGQNAKGQPQIVAIISIFPSVEEIEKAQAEGVPNAGDFELPFYAQLISDRVDITFDNLKVMGYEVNVEKTLLDVANGTGWDTQKEFEVVVELGEYNGNKRLQIKGIWEVGASFIKKMSPADAIALMKGMNIKESVAGYLAGKKGSSSASKKDSLPPSSGPEIKESDIPNW